MTKHHRSRIKYNNNRNDDDDDDDDDGSSSSSYYYQKNKSFSLLAGCHRAGSYNNNNNNHGNNSSSSNTSTTTTTTTGSGYDNYNNNNNSITRKKNRPSKDEDSCLDHDDDDDNNNKNDNEGDGELQNQPQHPKTKTTTTTTRTTKIEKHHHERSSSSSSSCRKDDDADDWNSDDWNNKSIKNHDDDYPYEQEQQPDEDEEQQQQQDENMNNINMNNEQQQQQYQQQDQRSSKKIKTSHSCSCSSSTTDDKKIEKNDDDNSNNNNNNCNTRDDDEIVNNNNNNNIRNIKNEGIRPEPIPIRPSTTTTTMKTTTTTIDLTYSDDDDNHEDDGNNSCSNYENNNNYDDDQPQQQYHQDNHEQDNDQHPKSSSSSRSSSICIQNNDYNDATTATTTINSAITSNVNNNNANTSTTTTTSSDNINDRMMNHATNSSIRNNNDDDSNNNHNDNDNNNNILDWDNLPDPVDFSVRGLLNEVCMLSIMTPNTTATTATIINNNNNNNNNNRNDTIEMTPPIPPFSPNTTLYQHQKQSLAFMYGVETATTATTISSKYRGGWLANEEGMGKTVVVLALICLNPLVVPPVIMDTNNDNNNNANNNNEYVQHVDGPSWLTVLERIQILNDIENSQRRSRGGRPPSEIHPVNRNHYDKKSLRKKIKLKATVVITSNALMGQWEDECVKHAPGLKVYRFHPPSKDESNLDLNALVLDSSTKAARRLARADVILTTGTFRWPDMVLNNYEFRRVVLDEAHMLGKSASCCLTYVKAIASKLRWCITPTPSTVAPKMKTSIKNMGLLYDLEKQADFIGLLKQHDHNHDESFAVHLRECKQAIEMKNKSAYTEWDPKYRNKQFYQFVHILKKYMIRQTKRQQQQPLIIAPGQSVGEDLPKMTLPKTTIIIPLKMSNEEAIHYKQQLKTDVIQGKLKMFSVQAMGCQVEQMDSVLQALVYPDKSQVRRKKVQVLTQCLEDDLMNHRTTQESTTAAAATGGRQMKAAIFTKCRSMHADCVSAIKAMANGQIQVYQGDGTTNAGATARDETLRRFQLPLPHPAVFVCTWKKKSGLGVIGLNLTAASKVYMMEPWIDPCTEGQAVGRIKRVGQKQSIQIVQFVYKNTFEENIRKLHQQIRDKKISILDGILDVEAAKIITEGMI